MFKSMMCILMLIFSMSAMALDANTVASAGFSNLTDQQKAEVIANVTAKVAQNSSTSVQRVDEWLNVGERIGKGFAGAAKELGVAANEFVNTPVGKWVAFLIIWHFMGSMMVHVVFGLFFLFVGIFAINWYVRINKNIVTTYDADKTDIFGQSRKLSTKSSDISGDMAVTVALVSLILTAIAMITIFAGW